RAGGDDDRLLGSDPLLGAVLGRDLDRARADQRPAPFDDVRPVRAQQLAHASGELLDDAVLPILHAVDVDRDVADDDSVIRNVLRFLLLLGVRVQRLRRDAPPVEAHAAVFFLLDARRLHAELSETDRAHVTAGATAQDNGIVRSIHGDAPHSGPRIP